MRRVPKCRRIKKRYASWMWLQRESIERNGSLPESLFALEQSLMPLIKVR